MKLKDLKWFVLLSVITMSSITYAQEKNKMGKSVFKSYEKALHLSVYQSQEFKAVLDDFDEHIKANKLSANSHNKLVKARDLKLQSVLNTEQFESYISLKKELEPNATYKFQ